MAPLGIQESLTKKSKIQQSNYVLQAGVSVELRRIPDFGVSEFLRQRFISRFVKVKPTGELSLVGSGVGDYFPFVFPESNAFQHVYL